MSYFERDDGFYGGSGYNGQHPQQQPQQGNDYTMGNFGQEQSFAQFEYNQQSAYTDQGYGDQTYADQQYYPQAQPTYSGSLLSPDMSQTSPAVQDFEEEPPLLEELGINFDHIFQKTLAVLNPMQPPGQEIMQDTDLAGPLVFCLAFGGSLLLCGKLHFGYIYGIGLVGCVAMYFLLNMMSLTGVSASCITSVLGYCLLPMVLLSFFSVFITLKGLVGMIMTGAIVLWCSTSASNLFVTALAMQGQQILVAYPCALVYGVFALLTVF